MRGDIGRDAKHMNKHLFEARERDKYQPWAETGVVGG